jgi:hypothetical protein
MPENTSWNVENAMAQLRASNTGGGRKMSFNDQCAAFAAMYGGAKNMVVARAFDISLTTASNISGCLEQDPTPWQREMIYRDGAMVENIRPRDHNKIRNPNRSRRYENVAREFEALGVDIFERIRQAHREIRAERNPKPRGRPKNLEGMSGKEIQAWRISKGLE